MKLTAFAVCCLITSSLAADFDATTAQCNAVKENPCCQEIKTCPVITTCCPRNYSCCGVTFEAYGELLVLQPNGSNLYYAVEAIPFDPSIAFPAASPNWEVFEVSPNYTPGFQVGTKFIFPDYDMNLELNWERLHAHKNESHTVPITEDMIGPIFDIGPNASSYKKAKGHGIYHFDSVNLLFGKMVCFVNRLSTNLYAGASFARIKQSMNSEYSNLSGTISRSIYNPSTFTGAGTKFGVSFDYLLGKGFYFTGNTSAALIMGQLKNKTTYKSFTPEITLLGNPQPNVQTTTVPNRSQLVPGFEEELGFSYVLECNRCKFTFGAGYQFQIYLNAVQSFDMISQVLPTLAPYSQDVSLNAVAYQRTLSNFILSGPYVSLHFDF